MSTEIKLLDYGYVKLVHAWGGDQDIVEDARMSTDKGFLGWGPLPCIACDGTGLGPAGSECPSCAGTGNVKGDEKLLRYLYTEKPMHSTPFEGSGMKVEIKAPIFVFREWHRHRTQSYNEMSARYTPLPNENYIPSVERLMMGGDGKNKQAGTVKDAFVLTEFNAVLFQDGLRKEYDSQQRLYEDALKYGVPKELARIHLPVGRYSRMRASANLLNWLKFLTLRMHGKAMYEIRMYANAVGSLIQQHFPRTYALFEEERPK